MFRYIYYGYIGGYAVYKMYEYWEIVRFAYTTCSYTYSAVNGVYRLVKPLKKIKEEVEEEISSSDWDMCEV